MSVLHAKDVQTKLFTSIHQFQTSVTQYVWVSCHATRAICFDLVSYPWRTTAPRPAFGASVETFVLFLQSTASKGFASNVLPVPCCSFCGEIVYKPAQIVHHAQTSGDTAYWDIVNTAINVVHLLYKLYYGECTRQFMVIYTQCMHTWLFITIVTRLDMNSAVSQYNITNNTNLCLHSSFHPRNAAQSALQQRNEMHQVLHINKTQSEHKIRDKEVIETW